MKTLLSAFIIFAVLYIYSALTGSSDTERFMLNAKMKAHAQRYNHHYQIFEENNVKGMQCGTVTYKRGSKGQIYKTFCYNKAANKLIEQ